MQNHDVPVGILDKAHVADPTVLDPDDLTAGCTDFLNCRRDICDTQRDPVLVRHESFSLLLGQPERERDILGLDLKSRVLARRQPQDVSVPSDGAVGVACRHGDEVDALNPQSQVTSNLVLLPILGCSPTRQS
jgi:hypothetical protein